MKKSTLIVSALLLLAGCSSNSLSTKDKESLGASVLEDKTLGDTVPAWTKFEGIKESRLYGVGYAEMSLDKSEHYISKAALMDGEVKLISDSPSDFRVITQNALTGAGVESSDFVQIQTKLQEVIGATGFKSHEYTCRKIVRYQESQSKIMRGCWYQVSVNILDLKRAYQLTLEKKYGNAKAAKFGNLMSAEIDKINDNNRFPSSSSNQ